MQLTEDFRPLQSWTLPKEVLDRFDEMSNSGGSWGPDGFLYLSGHDPAEVYKMALPEQGSVLRLVEIAFEFDLQGKPVDLAFFFLALFAILGVNAFVRGIDADVLKRPAFAAGVHRDRHRRAASQGAQQQLVGVGAEPVADAFGLVADPGVAVR